LKWPDVEPAGRFGRPRTVPEDKNNTENSGGNVIQRRTLLKGLAGAAIGLRAGRAGAEDVLKMGVSIPLTGAGFNAVGRQLASAIKLYTAQHGNVVAGRKLEIIVRDDGGVADNARRTIQEMIVNEKVGLVGIGITPTALAIAPLVTEAKIPTLVLSSGASVTVTKSPYMVRAGFLQGQQAWIMAEWAAKNGSKRVVTMVNDWAPGIESETAFKTRFVQAGGEIIESIRIPLANPDFAPFLQRVRDLNPDTAFIYFPGTQASIFAKQFAERGLGNSGIKIIGPGDLTDDDDLNTMGDQMLGIITSGSYSAAHDSALNKSYVAAFETANGFRPDFVSVGAYDGLHLIYEALKKTDGNADGDTLLAAMKGMAWESPRGPISIDPQTRDIVQNIYIRKVEKVNGQLYSIEFATYEAVKDPMKPGGR
jgi:branched-chain amino acid transport system substrate-binding protein